MIELAFISGMGMLLAVIFLWAFRELPNERWQILAAVPQRKADAQHWQGLNLTYYGLFLATACMLAVGLLLALLAAIGAPPGAVFALIVVCMALCLPAARLVSRVVEGQRYNFTVAGAFFVGCLTLPFVVGLVNRVFDADLPLVPTLAAVAVCYALGESVGRLACLSFGCCYGKPIAECSPLVERLFAPVACVFHGPIKKAAYEGHLEGVRLVPVQALTAVWFAMCCLVGLGLFLAGQFRSALVITILATQSWRWASEFLRADYRGPGRWSAYQGMALLAIAYAAVLAAVARPLPELTVDLSRGWQRIWSPTTILFLQALWVVVFLYTGRSQATASQITLMLVQQEACAADATSAERNAPCADGCVECP